MKNVQPEKARLQRVVFSDILQSKFMFFRTTEQTKEQLKSVGFKEINIIKDSANIFPTVVALK
jgi:hypothetical protein